MKKTSRPQARIEKTDNTRVGGGGKTQTVERTDKRVLSAERDGQRRARAAEKRRKSTERAAENERLRKESERERETVRAARERAKAVQAKERAELAAARKKARDELLRERARLAEIRRAKRRAFYAVVISKLRNRSSGFGYRNYGILPRVELIVGGDCTSVMTRLSASGINAADVVRVDGKTAFKIRKKDLRKAVAILDEMCYNYRIGESYGAVKALAFCAARAGLFAGAAIAVCLTNIAYGYVWRVEISGNVKLSDAAIESVLKGAGVSAGRKKSALDAATVSAAVGTMDGVVDAAAEIVGTTLYVYVLEAEDYTVHGTYGAYDSAYDATVTRIVLRSGSATVARGDVVKRGDRLASGEVYSTTGELLYVTECDAEIYGNVSLTFSADVGTAAIEYERTGREKTTTVVELFGIKLGKSVSPFDEYECESVTTAYDTLLPLYVTTTVYRETAAVEVERDVNAVAEAYAAEKIDELRFVGDFNSDYTVKPLGAGLYRVNVFLSGEALISRGVEKSDGGGVAD